MRTYIVKMVAVKTRHPFDDVEMNIVGQYEAKSVVDLLKYLKEEYDYTYIKSMEIQYTNKPY